MTGIEGVSWVQIVDANWDQAIYTASPNDTINVAQFAAKGSGSNIAVAITPKGTGYITAQVPDGTAAGGNARGIRCVDLQMSRSAADRVAAGSGDIVIGSNNKTMPESSNGYENICIGYNNQVINGYRSHLIGRGNISAAPGNIFIGLSNYADSSNNYIFGDSCSSYNSFFSTIIGFNSSASNAGYSTVIGRHARSYIPYGHVRAAIRFSTDGDCQQQKLFGKIVTTNDTPAEVLWPTGRLTIPTNRVWRGTLIVTAAKSDGAKVANYERRVLLKRVGAATTLVSLDTIGIDIADGTVIAITADDVKKSLNLTVTGVAGETFRWMAVFEFNDLLLGT